MTHWEDETMTTLFTYRHAAYIYPHVSNTDQVRHNSDASGGKFFSPATMRAFGSRLLSGYWEAKDKLEGESDAGFFVTSDIWWDGTRVYNVRKYVRTETSVDIWSWIVDAGDSLPKYRTAREAKAACKVLAQGGTPKPGISPE